MVCGTMYCTGVTKRALRTFFILYVISHIQRYVHTRHDTLSSIKTPLPRVRNCKWVTYPWISLLDFLSLAKISKLHGCLNSLNADSNGILEFDGRVKIRKFFENDALFSCCCCGYYCYYCYCCYCARVFHQIEQETGENARDAPWAKNATRNLIRARTHGG